MTSPGVLGPTTARNWGWTFLLSVPALLSGAVGADALLGGNSATSLAALAISGLCAAGAAWVWRQPPFEQTALRLTETGVSVEGRSRRLDLDWAEIAAVTYRPSSMGPAHMTIERAAAVLDAGAQAMSEDPQTSATYVATALERSGATGFDQSPGLMFPVKAVGVPAEEVVAFLARGADAAGYRLIEPLRADGRAIHRFPGPRRWVMTWPGDDTPGAP